MKKISRSGCKDSPFYHQNQ